MNLNATTFLAEAAADPVYGMTSGRIAPTLAAVLALAAVVWGAVVLARGVRAGSNRALQVIALGACSAAGGALLWATAGGGPGTGNGIVASWAAVALGLLAVVLGATASARSRRAA